MMKRNLLNVVMAVCGVLLLTACPKDSEPEISLTVSPTLVTLDANNKATIKITSNGKWTVRPLDSWLSPYPSSGSGNQDISIMGAPNTFNATRVGEVVITDETGRNTITVSVTQNPSSTPGEQSAYYVNVSPTSLIFANNGGEGSFIIDSNDEWSVKQSDNTNSWLAFTSSGKTVTVTARANETITEREATITVTGKNSGVSKDVKVTQAAGSATLSVSPTSLSFSNSGGTDSFTIDSNDECSVKQTSNTSSWLTVTPSGNTVSVTARANETATAREATITVTGKNSGVSKEVKVTQAAALATLSVSPSSLAFEVEGGSATVSVSSNDGWSVSNKPDWCSIDVKSASFTVTVKQNSGSERSGNVVVRTSLGKKATVGVLQKSGTVAVDLGLPSGTKWANMNVGAEKPEDYGDYFAWGETKPKEVYNWSTYIHCDGLSLTCHYLGDNISGDSRYDAARANWGGQWRMPTIDEMQELIDNCTWEWTQQNGVNGGKFTSKRNGNFIFLPAAGCRSNASLYLQSTNGYYWSASVNPTHSDYARYLNFSSGDANWLNDYRYHGQSVRPVR